MWIHVCGSWTPRCELAPGARSGRAIGFLRPGIGTPAQCPAGRDRQRNGGHRERKDDVPAGARLWQINAPQGFSIVGAHTEGSGMVSYGVNQNMGWGGGFYWQGGGAQAYPGEVTYSSPAINLGLLRLAGHLRLEHVQWGTKPGEISVLGLEIEACRGLGSFSIDGARQLGRRPAVGCAVRGQWRFPPTGRPERASSRRHSAGSASRSQSTSHRARPPGTSVPRGRSLSRSTRLLSGSGPSVPLVMWARDAAYDYAASAYLSSAVTKYVNIDNDPVTVSMSGPTDAPDHSRRAVRHRDRLGRASGRGRAFLLAERRARPVVPRLECPRGGAEPRSELRHVLSGQQRSRRGRQPGVVRARVVDAQHPSAHDGRALVRLADPSTRSNAGARRSGSRSPRSG